MSGWGAGLALAVVAGTWLPRLVPTAIRAFAAAAYRSERDQKMLEWMRKLRLLTSAGQPINAAAVNAALTVSGRAFTVAQGAIGAALEAGRDPLPAVTAAIAGSPAEPLLASVVAAERAGAASSDLLDKSLSRSVRTLDAERRSNREVDLGKQKTAGFCYHCRYHQGALACLGVRTTLTN